MCVCVIQSLSFSSNSSYSQHLWFEKWKQMLHVRKVSLYQFSNEWDRKSHFGIKIFQDELKRKVKYFVAYVHHFHLNYSENRDDVFAAVFFIYFFFYLLLIESVSINCHSFLFFTHTYIQTPTTTSPYSIWFL